MNPLLKGSPPYDTMEASGRWTQCSSQIDGVEVSVALAAAEVAAATAARQATTKRVSEANGETQPQLDVQGPSYRKDREVRDRTALTEDVKEPEDESLVSQPSRTSEKRSAYPPVRGRELTVLVRVWRREQGACSTWSMRWARQRYQQSRP